MVKGETYDLQLFESEAFRHFINVFTNKQSGITLGCVPSHNTQNINISSGYFFIQGGLLREDIGTSLEIPTEAGYYKLVYEIDLSKTNQKDVFNQGSYKFVKSLGGYPDLIQEDVANGENVYQLGFCSFRITESGMQDFADIRSIIDFGIYLSKEDAESFVKKTNEGSITAWHVTNQEISMGNNFKVNLSTRDKFGDVFNITGNNEIKVLKDCRAYINSKVFVQDTYGKGYVQSILKVNGDTVSSALEIIQDDFTNCVDAGGVVTLKKDDLIALYVDYTSGSGNPVLRSGRNYTEITVFTI